MAHWIRKTVLLVAMATFVVATTGLAEEPPRYREEVTDGAMLGDLVFLRPVGLVGTGLGAVAWVVALPFTLPTHTAGLAGEKFVKAPFRFTFQRPFGLMPE